MVIPRLLATIAIFLCFLCLPAVFGQSQSNSILERLKALEQENQASKERIVAWYVYSGDARLRTK